MPDADVILTETVGTTRVITLNRPAARNAWGGRLPDALAAAIAGASDPAVTAVVLTGADPAFCAGVDLKELAAQGASYFAHLAEIDLVDALARLPVPVIGAINGPTFTGGLELALACDFLIASERAAFADTHVRVGVIPGGGMTARLPLLVGEGWARRMSLSGEVVDAGTALRIGLVTEVVGHNRLRERALELAAAMSDVPTETMRALKGLYLDNAATTVSPALANELRTSRANPPAYARVEERRRAVMERNKAAIDSG
jgi:enoyl-CoA hydratase/carnithine racemase